MSKPWWAFFWVPYPSGGTQPGPDYTVPNIEHSPIKTRKGRVVYNRKIHKFSAADRDRILFNFYNQDDKNSPSSWITVLERITIDLMQIIFERFSPGDALSDVLIERIYYLLRDSLAWVLDHMGDKLRAQADEELGAIYGL